MRTNKNMPALAQKRGGISRRISAVVLGALAIAGGSALVQAGDGPDVYETVRRFAAPRRAETPVAQRYEAPLPKMFRAPRPLPPQALSFAPTGGRFAPLPRIDSAARREFPRTDTHREFPRTESSREFPRASTEHGSKPVRKAARRKLQSQDYAVNTNAAGIATATNYCVRTCDGYAFPIGNAGGNLAVQEVACRSACPGAETVLYSAPAGAKDLDALSRGGASYASMPNAFRYREKLDSACRCHAPGAETNPSAYLTDLTMRRGDLVMTRIGFRHFEGSARLPYRPRNFTDAVARLTNPTEVAIVRAKEVASVRGILPSNAPDYLRDRVSVHMRHVEREARREASNQRPVNNLGRGFRELNARDAAGKTPLKTVQRAPGIVALN